MSRSPQSSKDTFPTKEQILDFVSDADGKIGKREIARAFNIKGNDKIHLKRLLREMIEDGMIDKNGKSLNQPGSLPSVMPLLISHMDEDGDLFAKPANWSAEDGSPPKILVRQPKPSKGRNISVGLGDRVLARLEKMSPDNELQLSYIARPFKKIGKGEGKVLGVYKPHAPGPDAGTVEPIDKKNLKNYIVSEGDQGKAQDGDLVTIELSSKGRYKSQKARVIEIHGKANDLKSISMIAIAAHGIPSEFPQSVLEESERAEPIKSLGKRLDLRQVPLITIDPPDARDHDDAVFAEVDDDASNPNGWIIYVAIADVSHYITPHSEMNKEALKRGNSVYFPDQVVPMLPEKISNDLCSLKEGVDRPAMALRMVFDADGNKKSHQFMRIMMRSAARLSYNQAQSAIDGKPDEATQHLLEPVLKPLWQAYRCLSEARKRRGPLELEVPEKKIEISPKGTIERIYIPERLDAHKLIEEFMIQANVAAAETLESIKSPLLYRAHDAPGDDKLEALREYLATLDIKLSKGGHLKPDHFNGILTQVVDKPHGPAVNEAILRSQSRAEYTAESQGHFGLNLRRYAHFTSPIRRYADLIVHRALISALDLGDDGLTEAEANQLNEIATDISNYERRAMAAERDTVDRLIAFHLSGQVGAEFEGRISGVTRAGLFIELNETGADGFIPISTLATDYFLHIENMAALVGEKTGETYSLGDQVTVRLVEAAPFAGALRFEMLTRGKYQSARKVNRLRKTTKKKPKFRRGRR